MMYVIYNNDGSIRYTNLCEIITKNSNNVSEIFISVDGYDTDDYNCDATFELSNGTANSLVATVDSLVLDTTTYYGWKFSLTSAQTACAGDLLMSAMLKDLSDNILFTFPINLFVNNTPLDPDETLITVAQYNNLRNAMLTKQDKFGIHTLRIYDTYANATADLTNLVVGQLAYVIAQNKLYQVNSSNQLVLVNDNYLKEYNHNEYDTFDDILEDVGYFKLFIMPLYNVPSICKLGRTLDNKYKLEYWNELGYGEAISDNSTDDIDDFAFTRHYYFPYIEKNGLSGSLTDEEIAIVSQDNSLFVNLGTIYRKVNSTTFEYVYISHSTNYSTIGKHYITVNFVNKTYTYGGYAPQFYHTTAVESLLNGKQNLLINQFNIKSINGQSILGSGDLTVGGGGNAEWGNITGDIDDQTDLQNALQNIREVAEGKCKTVVLSYQKTAPTNDTQAQALMKIDGTYFTDLADFNSYVTGMTIRNSIFNSQNDYVNFYYVEGYLISNDNVVYRGSDINTFREGDIFIITETVDSNGDTLPDRWLTFVRGVYQLLFYKLETGKVDLSSYATITDLSNALKNLAGLYDSTLTYSIGEVVIYNNKLYRCSTAITTPEAWDSTHWTQTTIAGEFVNLHGSQSISGNKNFTGSLQKSGVDVATINTFSFKKITYADYQALSDNDKNALLAVGCQIIGTLSVNVGGGNIINPVLFPCRDYSSYQQGIFIAGSGTQQPCLGTWEKVGQGNTLTIKLWFRGSDQNMIIQSLTTLNNRSINYYLNNVYPYMINSGTELKYETVNVMNISADTTFTLATAPTNTYPEYKANITNSGASAITITLPSGTVIKGNVSISSNTFEIPAGSEIELNIQNSKAIVVEW